MPDDDSKERLKKKVLDRWENEGGKISAEETKMPESDSPRKPKRKKNHPPLSREIPAESSDNSAAGKSKPVNK
jgi:hypothetical protein